MHTHFRAFFGLRREPFAADLQIEEILQTPALLAVADRFRYTIGLGAIALVTGEVGSGKSTALRWAASRLHLYLLKKS
jgi:general secretion pathway protein A